MSSKYMAKSRSFVYASRLSRFSPNQIEHIPIVTPQKQAQQHSLTPTKSKAQIHDKVDSILKHNNYLLSQNNKFVNLLREKDNHVRMLQDKIDELQNQLNISINGVRTLQHERNQFIASCKQQITTKQYEISQLLTHTDMLKSKLSSLQSQHKIQLLNLRQDLIVQTEIKQENSKKAQLQTAQSYEIQVLKLKQLLQSNNRQYQSRFHQLSILNKQQEEQIRILTSDNKHLHTVKTISQQELRINFQNKVNEITRQMTNKLQKQKGQYQNIIRRMKKDIGQKQFQVNRLSQKLEQMKQTNFAEYDLVNQQKTKANIELGQLEIRNKEQLQSQKVLLKQLSEAQAQNIKQFNENFIKSLESQNKKLIQINNLKSQQIVTLQTEILQLKQTHAIQLQSAFVLQQTLQTKLISNQLSNQQECELLKVKMSQLHNTDVSSLCEGYEKQIVALCQKIKKLQDSYKECRIKLHKELQQKTELRKHYQIQISKIFNKNIELKVMIQAKNIEMKQNNQAINVRHSAVSLGLIKNSQQKKKEKDKTDDDNKKLQELIISKDLQITVLNEKLNNTKKLLENQKKQHTNSVDNLKNINESLVIEQRKQKQFYQKQLKKKADQFKQEKLRLQQQLEQINTKTYDSLRKQLQQLQKQKSEFEIKYKKQVAQKEFHIKASNTNQQIAQVLRLQSSVAIEQQKSNSKAQQQLQDEKWQRTFNEQMQSKSKEIQQLKRRLQMKQQDLRQAENKQKDLQQRLQNFVQLMKSKSELQKRVINLGMDNNLLKNQAQLFKQ